MGNAQPESQKFSELNWRRAGISKAENHVFENVKDRSFHIQQHHIETISEDDFQKAKEIAFLRKNNPRWVSALYFEDGNSGSSQLCASKYLADLYLQAIPIRLSNIRGIPFPDALHLYDQALNGYSEFAKNIGRFGIEKDYIGVNQRGVVKVWAGPRFQEISVKTNSISEEDMVRSIVNCLEQCTDRSFVPPDFPSLSNFLYRNSSRINFETALKQFKNYTIHTNAGSIPSRLNGIDKFPQSGSISKQIIKQTYQPRQAVRAQPPEMTRYFSPSVNIPQLPPNHSQRIQQLQPQQFESIRRVNSLSSFPIINSIPQAQFYQEIRKNEPIQAPSGVSRQTLDRSLSNPQLFRPLLASSSSQQILSIQPVPNYNRPVNGRPIQLESQVRQAIPVQQPFSFNPQTEQSKQFKIIKQQDLSIIPSSQTEIRQQQALSPSYSRKDFHVNFKDEQKSSSIIMPPAVNSTYNPINTTNSSKYIQQFKTSTENLSLSSLNKDYTTNFLKESQSSIKETPKSQFDSYLTPIGINKKELSNLNSIQEVQTQHYWKDNSSKKSEKNIEEKNPESYSLGNFKQSFKIEAKELTFKKYNVIDSNDGKSSDDFLEKLKAISSGTNIISNFDSIEGSTFNKKAYDFTSTPNYDFGSKDYSKTDFDFKPTPNYQNNYTLERKNDQTLKETPSDFNYKAYDFSSKNIEFKNEISQSYQTSDIFKKYASSGSGSYNGGIDPQLWQDLQKGKQ